MNPYESPNTTSEGRRKKLSGLFKAVWGAFTLCFVPAAAWCGGVIVWGVGFQTHRIDMETLAKVTTAAVVLSGVTALAGCVVILAFARRAVRNRAWSR